MFIDIDMAATQVNPQATDVRRFPSLIRHLVTRRVEPADLW